MNILYVSHTHPTEETRNRNIGGMQRVSFQLVQELGKKDSVNISKEVINVSEGFSRLQTIGFLLNNIVTLPQRVGETKADLILFSSLVTALSAGFLSNRISVPMVAICHGRDVVMANSIYQQIATKTLRGLDGVVSVSKATHDECVRRGMDPLKGTIIPNGVRRSGFEHYNKEAAGKELESLLGISLSGKKILLTAGRLVKRKGHEWFIRNVLPRVRSHVNYVVIGDGPEKARLRKVIEEKNLEGSVFLLGYQPDEVLLNTYVAADLFVMPNIPVQGDMEGFGIVLLEANLAGTPAVASDLEGIKDVITDHENGFKMPSFDADSFAAKIDEILNDDLQAFSERTKLFVKEKFSWQGLSEQYVSFFKKVLQHPIN